MIRIQAVLLGLLCLWVPLMGQYSGMTKKEVKRLAQETRRMAADFEHDFHRELNKSILDNTEQKGRYNNRTEKIEDHLDRAEGTVGNRAKMANHIERALESGYEVQRLLEEHRFPPEINREWARLRNGLNQLARITGVEPLEP